MHIKKIITLIIVTTLLYIPLYPFGGKPITIEKVRPYYTTDESVKVDVFIYTNLGENTNYNYLCFAVADAVANQIEYNKTLRLQSETNFTINPMDFERAYNYKVFQFTNIRNNFELRKYPDIFLRQICIYYYQFISSASAF